MLWLDAKDVSSLKTALCVEPFLSTATMPKFQFASRRRMACFTLKGVPFVGMVARLGARRTAALATRRRRATRAQGRGSPPR